MPTPAHRPITRFGLQINSFTFPGVPEGDRFERIAQIAVTAERSGFDSLWVMDHLYQISVNGARTEPMLEAYSLLAAIAARTDRAQLGTMVTGVTYRNPAMLAKTVTTLDVISAGRAILGIGAAWNEDEHRGLGVPFPPMGERFERLEETLQIALQMWSGDESPFQGRHYQLRRPLNSPQSLQRPHPPILVGGGGEKRTLRLVAQYADACNLFAVADSSVIKHKLNVLRDHCEAVGRPYSDIEKTALGHLHVTRAGRDGSLTPAGTVEYFAALAELGIDQGIVSLRDVHSDDVFDLLAGDVIPAVERIPVTGR
jgi:F420-dependent oxidoreductase-like protein